MKSVKLTEQTATDTLPKLLRRNAQKYAKRIGMREKDRGIWQSYTWRECHGHVRNFALGLAAAGFKRGDKLSVLGDNRARLYWAQVAAQALGGMSVPLYQDSIASELAYVLGHAEVSVVVAEDQEQVDKVLSIAGELPSLRLVVYDDPRGMSAYEHPLLKSFGQLEAMGAAYAKEHPGYFEREVDQGCASDIAAIAYTSGTTGRSKGALLSHGNMIATSEIFQAVEPLQLGDNWLCYLPMGWVGDMTYSLGTSMVSGACCNCPESPETVQRDLRELGPSIFLAPPRIWETMLTGLKVRAADASWLKRRVFEYFRALAGRCELLKTDGRPIPATTRLGYRLGEFFVYGPVRDQLGLRNARACLTGGAPLGADTFRFFRSFGVNLKQVYGATEACGLVSLQGDNDADPNTVGHIVPDTQVRIGERGEVEVKGPGVFVGYYKQDDATRDAITADGWLKTGDAGLVDPRGQLAIIDRAKDVGKLADGTPFAPQFIENKLKFSPFVREAVAFGDQRSFVAAMVAIDMTTVGKWAEQRSLPYTSYLDLARKPEVAQLIVQEVAKINATLPEAIQVRRIVLLNKELDADDAEITRTRKVRRGFVAEKYAPVIAALYDGSKQTQLTMDITFEDGRKSQLTSTMLVYDIAPTPAGRLAA
ncbi:MAG: long-chain fatty acid--CoA ligase [Alphaproteobacteria bacterium]|nr:MAG: long-chain fatty acid--CoA ligase [Alphaproteobacteria bacterium]